MCCGFRDNQYFFWDCNNQEATLAFCSRNAKIVETNMIAYIKKNYSHLPTCQLTYISDIEKPQEIFLNDQQKKLKAVTTSLTEGDRKQLSIQQDMKLSRQAKAIKKYFADKAIKKHFADQEISLDVPEPILDESERALFQATMIAYPDCMVGPKDDTLNQAIAHVTCEILLDKLNKSAQKNALENKLKLLTTIQNYKDKSTHCKFVLLKRLSIEDFATNLKQAFANQQKLDQPEKELLQATIDAYPDFIVRHFTQAIAHVKCEMLLENGPAKKNTLEKSSSC